MALAIFHYVLGNPANFMNNDPNNQPIPGNLMGTIYKGGMIVPVIQTLLLTVLVLSVERFFAIRKARGRGNLSQFIRKVKESLSRGDVKGAQELCDCQKGAVANVVRTALQKYALMEKDDTITKEQKIANIQAEVEQATALELPTLETESAGGSYYDYPGDFDGIVGYRNRDDQVVRSFGQCRCSRLDRFVYRYIRGVGQYGFRYYDRGAGCDLL